MRIDLNHVKKIVSSENSLAINEWKGAVLFLCDENHVYLIKRSETMPTHSGQVGFFGGHRQEKELDPWEVVQREFEEETGLDKSIINFLGYLPVVMTARGQPIVPVMAHLKMSPIEFLGKAISNGEWVDLICYKWERLAAEENWEFGWRNSYARTPVMFHAISQNSYLSPTNQKSSHLLWGATASMIWGVLNLYLCSVSATD
jgi:8-oxo-dGTP pyrophosphatase MutT (NUDIX family)